MYAQAARARMKTCNDKNGHDYHVESCLILSSRAACAHVCANADSAFSSYTFVSFNNIIVFVCSIFRKNDLDYVGIFVICEPILLSSAISMCSLASNGCRMCFQCSIISELYGLVSLDSRLLFEYVRGMRSVHSAQFVVASFKPEHTQIQTRWHAKSGFIRVIQSALCFGFAIYLLIFGLWMTQAHGHRQPGRQFDITLQTRFPVNSRPCALF